MYAGDKKSSGSLVERAELTGGNLYDIKVLVNSSGLVTEFSKKDWNTGDTFRSPPSVSATQERQRRLERCRASDRKRREGRHRFQRPQDGAWDPNNPSDYYFVTTSNITPEVGETVTRVCGGSASRIEPSRAGRLDQAARQRTGQHDREHLHAGAAHVRQRRGVGERTGVPRGDTGNNAYVAKQWLYDIESGKLVQIAQHDPERFVVGGTLRSSRKTRSRPASSTPRRSSGRAGTCSTHRPISRTAPSSSRGPAAGIPLPPGQIEKLFK